MTDPDSRRRFAAQLVQQDQALSDSKYKEYRMNLERVLSRAERRERIAGYVVVASLVVGLVLMFVGGSRVLGDFDPWSNQATALSVALGVVYVAATVLFWISLASYFSRFRPGVRTARDQLRDAALLDVQRQLRELREQLASSREKDGT